MMVSMTFPPEIGPRMMQRWIMTPVQMGNFMKIYGRRAGDNVGNPGW